MKLPEINFNRPVPDMSRTPMIVDDARRRAFETAEKALTIFGQEYVQSQEAEAGAKWAQSLNDIDKEIDENKTVSTEWVKTHLGGSLDALPPEVRKQVTAQALDVKTGEMVEADKADIPGWIVAPYIFDAKAKAALAQASQGISSDGWKADFQTKAQVDAASRRAKVNERAMREGIKFFNLSQTNSALSFANAGKFDDARKVVSASRSMDAPYKEKLLSHIDKIEQVKPIYEAVQREDFASMAELLGRLNNPEEFTTLEPQERTAFAERLKGEIRQFQSKVSSSADDELKRNADAGWRGMFDAIRNGQPVSYKSIPPTGTIPADEEKAMMAYVDARREGHPIKTNWAVYEDLRRRIAAGENVRVTAYRMSLADGQLSDLIHFSTAKNSGGSHFDNFITTEEAINSRLPKGFDPASIKGSPEKQAEVGQVKGIIQHELAALGHAPTLQERDDIIDKVIHENIKVEKGWIRDSVKVPTLGIPPKYVVALRRVASDLGVSLDDKGLAGTYKDFSYYEPGIATAWGPQARGRQPTPDLLLGVYGYLKANWGSIDAELKRVGRLTGNNEIDNPNRAALAVQGFLTNQR